MNLNEITLIGYIGKDAVTKTLPNTGRPVVSFSMATSESWKDEHEEWQTRTQWHQIVAYGDGFARFADRLAKGAQVFVRGQLLTRQYDATVEATHNKKKIEVKVQRLAVEVKADKINLLDRQAKDDGNDAQAEAPE